MIFAYLYDAKGKDEKVALDDFEFGRLAANQLLWIEARERDRETVEKVAAKLALDGVPYGSILNDTERPKLDIFEQFYRFFVVSVKTKDDDYLKRVPIDFLVGRNFVVTFADGAVDFFTEFRDREKGETKLGSLDAESFVVALLDQQIVTYFRALEEIEENVDRMDQRILRTNLEDQKFLTEMVRLRKAVSSLRRWFLPHRDLFYALTQPDFLQRVGPEAADHFRQLNGHFENAVDSIESSRDTVLSLFELYTTKSAQAINAIAHRLTFLTLVIGMLSVVAGVFGMNFQEKFFEARHGFWMTIGAMGLTALILTIIARYKRWI